MMGVWRDEDDLDGSSLCLLQNPVSSADTSERSSENNDGLHCYWRKGDENNWRMLVMKQTRLLKRGKRRG
jgi:hypothetical protein